MIGENVKHSWLKLHSHCHNPHRELAGIMLATDWTVVHRTNGLLITGLCQLTLALYDDHIDRQVVGLESQTLPGISNLQ